MFIPCAIIAGPPNYPTNHVSATELERYKVSPINVYLSQLTRLQLSFALSLNHSLSWHSAGCPLFGFPHVTPPYQWRGWNSNILLSQGHKSISRINNLLLPEVTQFAKSAGFGEGSQVQRQLQLMQLVATGNLDLSAILLFGFCLLICSEVTVKPG